MAYAKPATRPEPGKFYGHSPNRDGKGDWQLLFDHYHGATATQPSPGVALRARAFASWFGRDDDAFLAGLLHDLGKYSDTFTAHLDGARLKLDHWTAGAWVALKEFGAADVALAIEGHHIGLHRGERLSLKRLWLGDPTLTQEKNLQLTEANDPHAAALVARWKNDLADHGVVCPAPLTAVRYLTPPTNHASEMLAVRMLFSTLVDADFLETEAHFGVGSRRVARPDAPPLNAAKALARVRQYIEKLPNKADVKAELQALRRQLGDDCVRAAQTDDLRFTLTAPTGSGKTLAMLLFALERAARQPERFRRIVVALPYLSILDQTADIYHELFPAGEWGDHYILEHHSLAGTDSDENESGSAESDAARAEARLLTENWAAPIILTTNVQLFESLHANRPSTCRKLHNLSGSIILCDEVQTLPTRLAVPTLRTLSALTTPTYHIAVVFATATQPAFNALHAKISEDTGTQGWAPREIVADPPALFRTAAALRPVHADWRDARTSTSWETVAGWLREAKQALAIVNMRRHSVELANLTGAGDTPDVHYLSTYLCPAHRREVLAEVTESLKDGKPCRLIATQVVEAGVDLDFPLVCRALAPLDAIAQAAGRCNRNGGQPGGGVLRVFLPDACGMPLYPDESYAQAASVVGGLITDSAPDIADPDGFAAYFRTLYALNNVADHEEAVHKAIAGLDFADTAKHYRLIDKRGINVIIPYGAKGAQVWQDVMQHGLSRERIRAARPFTVSVFADIKRGTPPGLIPLTMEKGGAPAPDWFLLECASDYDARFGMAPGDAPRNGSGSGGAGDTKNFSYIL